MWDRVPLFTLGASELPSSLAVPIAGVTSYDKCVILTGQRLSYRRSRQNKMGPGFGVEGEPSMRQVHEESCSGDCTRAECLVRVNALTNLEYLTDDTVVIFTNYLAKDLPGSGRLLAMPWWT